MSKKISFIFIISSLFLAACGGVVQDRVDKDDKEIIKDGRLFGEDAFTFGGDDQAGGGVGGVAVNAFLWRAALDTISFMPLNQVDPFGGVIITDWYSPAEKPNERFKLNVYILAKDLRSDGLRISAFKEVKNTRGEWETAQISKDFSLKLEDSVLIRARQMRVTALENEQK